MDIINKALIWINNNKTKVSATSVWLITIGAFVLFSADPMHLGILCATAYLLHTLNNYYFPNRLSPSEICSVAISILHMVEGMRFMYRRWPEWRPKSAGWFSFEDDTDFLPITIGGTIIAIGVKGLEICFLWQ